MPDPLSHHPAMNIIRPDRLPTLWWLNPWLTVRYLHRAVGAFKSYADKADRCVDLQQAVISEQSKEIKFLRQRNDDLFDAIIKGHAINPDAEIHD